MNEKRNDENMNDVPRNGGVVGLVDDWPGRCACGCFLTVEGVWVGESHYDDCAKVYCSNPKCKLKKSK